MTVRRSSLLAVLVCVAFIASACNSGTSPTHGGAGTSPGSAAAGAGQTLSVSQSGVSCWHADPAQGPSDVTFEDVTTAAGLTDALTGMYGHAAAWGDFNGDMVTDLFVGTFADRPEEDYQVRGAAGPSPDKLFSGTGSGFTAVDFPERFGRTSGVAFVDLDNDGDLDLVVSRNPKQPNRGEVRPAHGLATSVFELDEGEYVEREGTGIDTRLGGRSVGVFDYDQDGLYDLLILEDKWRGGSSRLYRNLGGFTFEDTTDDAGIASNLDGLGLATADIDADGDIDFFVGGSNRLYINAGGRFVEIDSRMFAWPPIGDEDDPAGAAFGDVDRDGRPDLVVGHHFGSTQDGGGPVPIRLFLNKTDRGDEPKFVEAEDVGLDPLPTKAPHVEIADFDNDGWPDILTSASAAGGDTVAVFRNAGSRDSLRFESPAGLGSGHYWVTAPTTDYDRDGRVDVLAVEWDPGLPTILLRNITGSGNWLSVSVGPEYGFGLGASVLIYEAGGIGDSSSLLGSAGITASRGYAAGADATARFGLGDVNEVDVEVRLPTGTVLTAENLPVNQAIRLPGCEAG